MKMTVYVPDDLAAEVRADLGESNISAICQAALRAELNRQQARGKINAEGFERVETTAEWQGGDLRAVAFQGRSIATEPMRGTEAYLTPKGTIAVVGEGGNSDDELLGTYDSFAEFAQAGFPYDFIAEVAEALGEEVPAEELDI